MIRKWLYKLRYFLILLSALLWLLGLSSSYWAWQDPVYIRQIWTYGYNPYSQSFDITVLNSWLPLTSTLWITKSMFYFENWHYWRRWENGLPYVYVDNYTQWYIERYYTCTSIVWSWNSPVSNCTRLPVSAWTPEVFRAFFSNVSNNDYFQFSKWWADFWTTWSFFVSSDKLWQAIWWDWAVWVGWPNGAGLTWSLGYSWITFDSFVNSMWDNSAWGVPSWSWGWIVVNNWTSLTNWQVSNALWSYGFSKNICYWGVSSSADYSTAIAWTWKSIFQLYQEFNPLWISNIVDWYSYYRNWYIDYPYFSLSWSTYITDPNSPFLFSWNFMLSLYRLIKFWEIYWVSFYPSSDIIEYCDLLINKDPNSEYTGEDWTSIVNNSTVIDYWSSIYASLSWDYQQLYSWTIGNLSWEDLKFDSQSFFQNLTDKFSRFMDFDESWFKVVWIIPSYILVFMFALILLRIISK